MAVNPRDWVYGFINKLPGFLQSPLRPVADRIFSIFDDGVTFARWIKSGVAYWFTRAVSLAAAIVTVGAEATTAVIWLVKTFVPQRIAAAITAVQKWATPLIKSALDTAKSLVESLRKWAVSQLNSALSALNSLRTFITGKVNAIIDKLTRTVDVWFDRMTHPDKMAAWLAGALISPLWRYVWAQRARYAEAFLRLAVSLALRAAREIDALIARLL